MIKNHQVQVIKIVVEAEKTTQSLPSDAMNARQQFKEAKLIHACR